MCTHSNRKSTRRGFFSRFVESALAAPSILSLAAHRAAWAQALPSDPEANLFKIEKVTDDVYFANARFVPIPNCNAAIFVNANDVLVVDSHSQPSAAAALLAQIKREVTGKPVRYLVNSHFHWDHSQGNSAYTQTGHRVEILATKTTRALMQQNNAERLKASLSPAGPSPLSYPWVGHEIEDLRTKIGKSPDAQKPALQKQLQVWTSFEAQMKDWKPTLPTLTFDKAHVIKDKNHELHIQFHGRAHTAGDVIVFCPSKRVIASGDVILSSLLPFFGDSYPLQWPTTITMVDKMAFDFVMPGHGGLQRGHEMLLGMRDYIDEIGTKVSQGKKEGKNVAELQASLTASSLKTLQSGAYAKSLFGGGYVQQGVMSNILEMYERVDKG